MGVKLVGYTVAGFKLRAAYQREGRVPIAFGVSRTLLGVAAGLAYGSMVPSVSGGAGMLACMRVCSRCDCSNGLPSSRSSSTGAWANPGDY